MKCTLQHDINNCPFFVSETEECKRNEKCSFQEQKEANKPNAYVRKERWYEEYYKRKKR